MEARFASMAAMQESLMERFYHLESAGPPPTTLQTGGPQPAPPLGPGPPAPPGKASPPSPAFTLQFTPEPTTPTEIPPLQDDAAGGGPEEGARDPPEESVEEHVNG